MPIADVCDAIGIALEDWLRSPSQLRKIAVVTGRSELPKLTHSIRNILAEIETPEKCAERIQNELPGEFAKRWADTAAIPPFSEHSRWLSLCGVAHCVHLNHRSTPEKTIHFPRRLREALADVPGELRAKIASAVYVRNRLMHETSGSATLDDMITLNRAIYDLICWFHRDTSDKIGVGVAGVGTRPESNLRSSSGLSSGWQACTVNAHSPHRHSKRRRTSPQAAATITAKVEAGGVRVVLDSTLQQRGVVGNPDMRLLEGLLTTESLDFSCR